MLNFNDKCLEMTKNCRDIISDLNKLLTDETSFLFTLKMMMVVDPFKSEIYQNAVENRYLECRYFPQHFKMYAICQKMSERERNQLVCDRIATVLCPVYRDGGQIESKQRLKKVFNKVRKSRMKDSYEFLEPTLSERFPRDKVFDPKERDQLIAITKAFITGRITSLRDFVDGIKNLSSVQFYCFDLLVHEKLTYLVAEELFPNDPPFRNHEIDMWEPVKVAVYTLHHIFGVDTIELQKEESS
jgi:hypothetical protein